MPWRVTSPMTERHYFVKQVLKQERTLSELCEQLGISRKTGYKWIERFEAAGWPGLEDRSRAPHTCPWAVPEQVQKLLLKAREKHPTWGARKLIEWLRPTHPELSWPAASTVTELLKRQGLVESRPRRQRLKRPRPPPFDDAAGPNAVFCIDFKGWFRTQDGSRCNPLTVTDAVSRYLLCCQHLDRGTQASVQETLQEMFREYGLPGVLHSDNGSPFGSKGLGGLSSLSVWLMRLGIRVSFSQPGKPQQNGRHERMHRTMQEDLANAPEKTLRAQQHAMNQFRQVYNWERPHEALGYRTPGAVHLLSPRKMPRRLLEPQYPNAVAVKRVRTNGQLRWKGDLVYVGEAFIGERVGLEPIDNGRYQVRFCQQVIGVIDQDQERVVSLM